MLKLRKRFFINSYLCTPSKYLISRNITETLLKWNEPFQKKQNVLAISILKCYISTVHIINKYDKEVKLMKSDDQTNIDKYRVVANITEYHIVSQLILQQFIVKRQLFHVKNFTKTVKKIHVDVQTYKQL